MVHGVRGSYALSVDQCDINWGPLEKLAIGAHFLDSPLYHEYGHRCLKTQQAFCIHGVTSIKMNGGEEKKKGRPWITDPKDNRNCMPLDILHITFEIPCRFQPQRLDVLLLAAECIPHWCKCILQLYCIISNMAIRGPSEDTETCYWKYGHGPTGSSTTWEFVTNKVRTHPQSPKQIFCLTSSPDIPPMIIQT